MTKNIYLDFMNRDSRQIYGMFSNYSVVAHAAALAEALNVSVFLCREFCVMPPGFWAECHVARAALGLKQEYLSERLIRLPLRETSIEEFLEKKDREYGPYRQFYPDLFKSSVRSRLKVLGRALTPRASNVGAEIADQWERGPDENLFLRGAFKGASSQSVERIRRIPSALVNAGIGATWPAIAESVGNQASVDPRLMRAVLQHTYFSVYIGEFDLALVTGLPFALVGFGFPKQTLQYDYEGLGSALRPLRLWSHVRRSSARDLIRLRETAGYFRFRDVFHTAAGTCKDPNQIMKLYAIAAEESRVALNATKVVETVCGEWERERECTLTDEQIDAASERMTAVAKVVGEQLAAGEVAAITKDTQSGAEGQNRMIAIFVALQMEREFLIRRWRLKGTFRESVYTGELGQVKILLFGPDDMGRVPAAIETMRFLQTHRPNMILVLGIAGGFTSEGCDLGDVIVARSIADLATRKIREDLDGAIPEFRPREFPLDNRIERFLKTEFDATKWQVELLNQGDWPDGRRPTIRYGTLASLDEVVSSNEWKQRLVQVWPKLLGVEMEAGGVCAAAAMFDLKPVVIRGISDLADPAKSDTEWRRRAMGTVADLLENINFTIVLSE
jgi:nucleoside phosphorylase